MGKVKKKSFGKLLFEYSVLQIVLMLVVFLGSVQLNNFFQVLGFYKFKGENGILINFILLMIILIFCLNRFYSHIIKTEILQLTSQVEKLQDENLDIIIGHSKITEIEQTLRALEKLKHELEHSLTEKWRIEKQRNESILALGHDMKTPIAILQGNSELLNETELTQMQKIYNDSNLYNVQRMKQYTEALLQTFTSNEREKYNREYQNFDGFFDKLIDNYSNLSKKLNRTLETAISQCGEYYFDALMIERAINNLVMNAFEYTEEDEVIKVTLVKKDRIYLAVEDSGKGFSPELLEHATEAFVRGDKSRTKTKDELHLGIGLYQTKQIVENHDGKLNLNNSDTLGGAKIEIIL